MMIAALSCMMSCSEELNSVREDNVNYITVTSQVDLHTKAGYEGTSVLPEVFYIDIDQDGTEYDYFLSLSREYNTNNYLSAREMRWSGAANTGIPVKAMIVPNGLSSINRVNPMSVTINQDQSNPDNLKASDLIGASTSPKVGGIDIKDNNINIKFAHLMSKLQIGYTKPSDIEITSVVLENTCVKGGYSFKNMNYDPKIQPAYGDVTMFHEPENSAAEAIFFPYTPTGEPKLVVNVTINGENKAFKCPIVLKGGSNGFVGGKCYVMSVTISETGIEGVMTMIKDWNASNENPSIANERILWIGTSIPHGASKDKSYPKMVSDALGCEVINNAIGGSLVTMQKDASWIEGQGWDVLLAGALSQKINEATSIYSNRSQDEINQVVGMSYESLIIPYINGNPSYPQCTTVIIDHGYNDLSAMLFERNAFNYGNEPFRGYTHLMEMIERGEEYYNEYYNNVTTNWQGILYEYGCYLIAMKRIIDDIKVVNPSVKIIIGNYFTIKNPLFSFLYSALNTPDNNGNYPYPDYEHYAELICYSNEAIASVCDLDIVNVYEHLHIQEGMFCNLAQNYLNNLSDPTKFCPDGVHPTNEAARDAIADIWVRALRDILR